MFLVILSIGIATAIPARLSDIPQPTPSPDFQCPDNNDGFYRSSTSCSVYFHCTNGLAWKEECPAGLYFDEIAKLCDWPDQVQCNIRIQTPTRNPALRGVSIIGPAPDYECAYNGAHPHETDCLLFYDCWEGNAMLGTCTENMLYDLRYDGCNYASQVDCGDRIRPTDLPGTSTPPSATSPTSPGGSTGTPPPGNFTCSTNGVFPHESLCEYYYTCYEETQRLDKCSGELLFDLRYNGCNYPELTYCDNRERPPGAPGTITPPDWTTTSGGTQPTTTTGEPGTGPTDETTTRGTTTAPPGEFQCPEPDGNFADPLDCAGFYSCIGNVVIGHQFCPDGLYFNPVINNCDFPWNVDCDVMRKV